MNESPSKSLPSTVLQPNRNHDFKVPFAPGVAKPSENVDWRQCPSIIGSPSPFKQKVNDENRNPDKKALQHGSLQSSIQMDTPGKHLSDICNQFASLQLCTPGSNPVGKNESPKALKTKLPFSESFTESSKVSAPLASSIEDAHSPSHPSFRTLVIDDDDEYFVDASEELPNPSEQDNQSTDSTAFKEAEPLEGNAKILELPQDPAVSFQPEDDSLNPVISQDLNGGVLVESSNNEKLEPLEHRGLSDAGKELVSSPDCKSVSYSGSGTSSVSKDPESLDGASNLLQAGEQPCNSVVCDEPCSLVNLNKTQKLEPLEHFNDSCGTRTHSPTSKTKEKSPEHKMDSYRKTDSSDNPEVSFESGHHLEKNEIHENRELLTENAKKTPGSNKNHTNTQEGKKTENLKNIISPKNDESKSLTKLVNPFHRGDEDLSFSADDDFKDEEDQKAEILKRLPNPFKSLKELANSSVCKNMIQTENLKWLTNTESPFKTGKQLANSPVIKKDNEQAENKSVDDIADPFKTGKQLANSPVIKKDNEQAENKSLDDIADPFQTGKQLATSPLTKKNDHLVIQSKSESLDELKPNPCPKLNFIDEMPNPLLTPEQTIETPKSVVNKSTNETPTNDEAKPELSEETLTPLKVPKDFEKTNLIFTSPSGEQFRSAEEVFGDDAGWELFYGEDSVADASRLCRESLYVKFDPLLGSNVTLEDRTAKLKSLTRRLTMQKKKPFPKSPDLITMESPNSKRQSVYRKVGNNVKEEENKLNNIDEIFSMTPTKTENNIPGFIGTPLPNRGTDIVQVLQYTEKDWLEMKQNIEFECQNRVMSMGKAMSEKTNEMMKEYEEKLKVKEAEFDKIVSDLENKLQEASTVQQETTEKNADMEKLLNEYIVVIDHVMSEKKKIQEDSKNEISSIVKEKTQALEDLHAIEKAFADLHRRFEKSRTIIEGFQKNEEVLKSRVKELFTKVKENEQSKTNYQTELTNLKKKLDTEHSRSQALLKRKEMEIMQLKSDLETKNSQIEQLTKICDELLGQ